MGPIKRSRMSEILRLFDESQADEDVFTIAATVDTGFEYEAVGEFREKFQDIAINDRGRIYFNVRWDQFDKVHEMRSIDNVFILADSQKITFGQTDKEADLKLFNDLVQNQMNLKKGLEAWKRATKFQGKLYPTLDEYDAAKEQTRAVKAKELPNKDRKRGVDPSESTENDVLRYRATCERTGEHTFESVDVASIIGGELQDKYHWIVDLSSYHLEVICKVENEILITLLRVTHQSKHRRNIVSFGPTTLRSTICYNLLRLADPAPGDIVIDPMCGSGSIPIEGSLAYSHLYIPCGDENSKDLDRAKLNIEASATGARIDPVLWTALKLPFKDSFVDAVVTDMPFGKRSGKKRNNRDLYERFLLELGRVVKRSTGRIVLLTHDKNNFTKALRVAGNLFSLFKMVSVNIGGLQATAYVLRRTGVTFSHTAKEMGEKNTVAICLNNL